MTVEKCGNCLHIDICASPLMDLDLHNSVEISVMVSIFRHWTDYVLHRVMPVSWVYLDLWERRYSMLL